MVRYVLGKRLCETGVGREREKKEEIAYHLPVTIGAFVPLHPWCRLLGIEIHNQKVFPLHKNGATVRPTVYVHCTVSATFNGLYVLWLSVAAARVDINAVLVLVLTIHLEVGWRCSVFVMLIIFGDVLCQSSGFISVRCYLLCFCLFFSRCVPNEILHFKKLKLSLRVLSGNCLQAISIVKHHFYSELRFLLLFNFFHQNYEVC